MIDTVESAIIVQLRERLEESAGSAEDTFRVFTQFNSLLVRPRVQAAIEPFQTHLLDTVRGDFQALQNRFKSKYQSSQAYAMANVRDIPPVSGMVLWIKQIRAQLDAYLGKIQNILGKDWAKRPDGATLKVSRVPAVPSRWLPSATLHVCTARS